jgi:hypothetical protein
MLKYDTIYMNAKQIVNLNSTYILKLDIDVTISMIWHMGDWTI